MCLTDLNSRTTGNKAARERCTRLQRNNRSKINVADLAKTAEFWQEKPALVSPARPSRAERGSGELPIVEFFCTAPKTGWSRNAITRCGFQNNVVLRNTRGIAVACTSCTAGICYVRQHCYENHTSLSHSLTIRFWVLYRTTLL